MTLMTLTLMTGLMNTCTPVGVCSWWVNSLICFRGIQNFVGAIVLSLGIIWVSPSVSSWVSWVPLECHYIIYLYLTLTSLYLTLTSLYSILTSLYLILTSLYLTLTSLYLILTSLYSILTSLLYSLEYIEPAYISSVLTDDLNFIMKVDAEHIATMLFPVRCYCIKSCASFLGDTLRDIWGTFL